MRVSEIDFSKVPQKTIARFIKSTKLKDINDLMPLCYLPGKEPYSRHSKEYTINANIESVWSTYIFLHPTQCWDSQMISFGMMYSRNTDQVLYRESNFDQLKAGQLYFISLKILGKFLQIPVTHEINQVDHQNKVIKTCYLENGKSEGSQWIRLFPAGKEKTRIVHETIYKGDSKIREKYLYPFFHTKAIGQFHDNVRKNVKQFTEGLRLYPQAANTNPPQSA